MKRRQFITTASAVAAASATGLTACGQAEQGPAPVLPKIGPDGKRLIPWQNWSGYRHCYPAGRSAPQDEAALAKLLKNAEGTVRPVGAGHSFTELVPTDGEIVSLRHFSGMRGHDAEAMTATFGAGTKISQIGAPLDAVGQALANMPDIDDQTLAGAMATATHGTGESLGALHSYVTGLRLVTPTGEVLDCNREQNADVFDAARVSVGALGVITEYTLQNVPATRMKRTVWMAPREELMEQYDQLAAENHSFEIYVVPHFNQALGVTINPSDEPISPRSGDPDSNAAMELKKLRDLLSWWPAARRRIGDAAVSDYPAQENVDSWYRIFPSERPVRFNEMEYHMDREQLLPTLRKVLAHVEKHHPEVFLPFEVRVVNGEQDDAWLSPFYRHASASIAVHRYYAEDPLPLFNSTEPLLKATGGRPHWGKMNTMSSAEFAARYPRWDEFCRLRAELDPAGRMLNPYLKKVFAV